MGPMNGPSYFQGVMANEVLKGLLHRILELYMEHARGTAQLAATTQSI
jgi:hypothetical protein